MLFAAVLAVVQRDIKKVLAYSTVSQLGYMMAGLAVGAATAGIFHLWTHAFFKALLFLGAGSVIHAVHSNDMFEMGGLRKFMPVTYGTFLIGSLALAGVPPFAGFWSKDEIIAASFQTGHTFVFVAALITAFLTAFYMARACTLTFFGRYRRAPIAGGATDDAAATTREAARVAAVHGRPPRRPRHPLARRRLVGTPLRNFFAEWFHFEAAHHGEFVGWIAARLDRASRWSGIGARRRACTRGPTFGFGVIDPLERLGPLYRAAERRFYIDDFYMKVHRQADPVPALALRLQRPRPEAHRRRRERCSRRHRRWPARRRTPSTKRGVDGVVNGVGWLTDKLSFGAATDSRPATCSATRPDSSWA